jgi:hypothetical protein
LAVFRSFLDEYKQLILVATAAGAVPLFAALTSLTPTWPSGLVGITAVAQLLVLALVFQLLRSARRTVISRVMVRSTVILCFLLLVYFVLLSLFTYTEPASKERFTKGYECTSEATIAFSKACPLLGFNEIRQAEFEEELLWTAPSVSFMKSVILTVWLASFAALSTALGSFVVFQMEQKHK